MEHSPSPSQQSQQSSAWPPTQQQEEEEDSGIVGMSMADVDDEEEEEDGAGGMGTGTGTQPDSTPSEPEPEPEEEEEDEEEGETVVEGEPPALEEAWGEGVKGEEYFGAVIWQGQRFRVGDSVEVLMEGEPQPATTTTTTRRRKNGGGGGGPTESRAYGEIVWLFRRLASASSSSSQSDNEEEEEEEEKEERQEEEEEEEEVMAEVRWYHTPVELLPKPEDRAKCLMRELFEGDQVDEVPVEAFNDRIRVVAPRHVPRYPDEEVYVCRRLYVAQQRAFLPLGHRALQPKARRARALNYSARRDQAPQAQVEQALRAAAAIGAGGEDGDDDDEIEEEEGSEGGGGRSSLSTAGGDGENADPNAGGAAAGGGQGKGKGGKRGRKRRRAGEEEGEEEGQGNEPLALLARAEGRLHLSSSPWTAETKAPSLPCRERETQEMMDFLLAALADFYRNNAKKQAAAASSSSRGGLYIAGFPGTGKTATVHHVLGRLRRERKDLPFTHIEVNGLTLSTPAQAYPILWAALTDQKEAGLTPARACARLADFFTTGTGTGTGAGGSGAGGGTSTSGAASRVRRSRPVVLVLDEMDYMVTGSGNGLDGKVIYNLLEWGAGGDGGRRGLIMIGLSNTVDLPERVMQPRVQSRLSLRRVRFEPYSHLQVASILKARLSGGLVPTVLDEQGIQMCARKVANVSGDLRKAFQVCRHAIDLKRRALLAQPPVPPAAGAGAAAAAGAAATAVATAQQQQQGGAPLITIELVNQAARELQEKPVFKAVQEGLSNVQVLLLVSIVRATMESGRLEAPFAEVYRRWLAALQKMHEIPAEVRPAYGEALEVAQRLALDGFLRLSRSAQGPGSAAPLVALALQPGDVAEAVRKGRPKALYELLPADLRNWHTHGQGGGR